MVATTAGMAISRDLNSFRLLNLSGRGRVGLVWALGLFARSMR